jgi:hypothetical protein
MAQACPRPAARGKLRRRILTGWFQAVAMRLAQ